MMKKFKLQFTLLFGIAFAPQIVASTTTLTEWGTTVSVVSGVCAGDSCTPLDVVNNPITSEASVAGPNQLSSATGVVTIPQGSAQASATVTGNVATPVLKAEASSATDTWVGASAFAVQGYDYTGISSQMLNLDIQLDGFINNPDSDTATGFGVTMYLFTPGLIDFDLLTIGLTDPIDLEGLITLTGFFESLPEEQVFELDITANGIVSEVGVLSLMLNPGDQFYIAGGLLASAGGVDAIADAFSTLTVTIDPKIAADLVAAGDVAAVPLPATIWLFMSAVLSLSLVRKNTRLRRVF